MDYIRELIAQRPSYDKIESFYGSFSYRPHPVQYGAIVPDARWEVENIVGIPWSDLPGFPLYPFPTGPGQISSGVKVHRKLVPLVKLVWQEVVKRGLVGRLRAYNGSYNPRHQLFNPSLPLSVHSWGAAFDFDARWNGYGLPAAQMTIDRQVVRVWEEYGFAWGGRWHPTDGMHLEFVDHNPNVPLPSWQDAMARATPHRVFLNGNEVTGQRVELGGMVVNATDPELTQVRSSLFSLVRRSDTPNRHAFLLNGVNVSGQRLVAQNKQSKVIINAQDADRSYIGVYAI